MLISYDWFVYSFSFLTHLFHTYTLFLNECQRFQLYHVLSNYYRRQFDSETVVVCKRNLEFTKANTLVRGRQNLTHFKTIVSQTLERSGSNQSWMKSKGPKQSKKTFFPRQTTVILESSCYWEAACKPFCWGLCIPFLLQLEWVLPLKPKNSKGSFV